MDNHLTNIEIKNFKCFKDFKADGFKRVNLIGGKNNVGKTAFMEACYINVSAQNIKAFIHGLSNIKLMRETLNILDDLFGTKKDFKVNDIINNSIESSDKIYTKSNINLATFKIKDEKGVKQYIFKLNKEDIEVNINDFSYEMKSIDSIKFIDNFGLSNNDIVSYYSSIQKKDEEAFLNNILNKFDTRIESFKVIDEKPQCKIGDEYLEVTEFGDGVRHLISIVTALYSCEYGYLFIDEIDNGIHYTQLDEIWTIVLEVSDKLKVQVFATTHSKECIESYARISKELKDDDIGFISLYKDKESNIKSVTLNSQEIQDRIELGLDNR